MPSSGSSGARSRRHDRAACQHGGVTPAEFWDAIHACRTGIARDKDEAALALLTSRLTASDAGTIAQFEECFRQEVDALNDGALRDIAQQLWVLNDEDWLHLRAWCVSKGREFVDRLRRSSAMLRSIASQRGGPFDPPSGEVFLYCAAYARVTRGAPVAG